MKESIKKSCKRNVIVFIFYLGFVIFFAISWVLITFGFAFPYQKTYFPANYNQTIIPATLKQIHTEAHINIALVILGSGCVMICFIILIVLCMFNYRKK